MSMDTALGREVALAGLDDVLLADRVGFVDLGEDDVVAPEVGEVAQHLAGGAVLEQPSVDDAVAEHEAAVAFEIHARHTGGWTAPDGVVRPATEREVVVQGLDIFRFDNDGRVRAIWAVNDLGDALTRASSAT